MIVCKKCGANLNDSAKFCTVCGELVAVPAPQPQQQPQQAQPQPEQQQPMNRTQQFQQQQQQAQQAQQQFQQQQQQQQQQYQPVPQPYQQSAFDPTDHTSEFTAKDISDNKVFAMLPYLTSFIGVIIALLAAPSSPYTMFHVRQGLKIMVTEILLGLVTALLVWTIIVPIAAGICMVILLVVQIICFVRVCKGQAKEVPIIKGFGFLK